MYNIHNELTNITVTALPPLCHRSTGHYHHCVTAAPDITTTVSPQHRTLPPLCHRSTGHYHHCVTAAPDITTTVSPQHRTLPPLCHRSTGQTLLLLVNFTTDGMLQEHFYFVYRNPRALPSINYIQCTVC